MPADPPERTGHLKPARLLLWLAFGLTFLPATLITADHLFRQKPAAEGQVAVFAAKGLSPPCFFPAGHPARMAAHNNSSIDWRPSPSLPPSLPGPIDLIRPSTARPGIAAGAR